MNPQVLREEKPLCFGRIDNPAKNDEGWNPQCPLCAGGIDPAYTDEKTGSHIRERCTLFQACGSIVQAKKMAQMRPALIDPKSLVKPQVSVQTPPAAYQPQNQNQLAAAIQQQQAAALQQQQHNALLQQMAQMQRMTPQVQGMMPMGFQQMMPVNYQMPSYLSTPEPVHKGGFWRMFMLTIFRSMGKSAGHSASYMFDSIPLGVDPPGK